MSQPKRQIEDIYPLTPLQQGMLFHALYGPEQEVYFIQLDITLEGRLDPEAFAAAWRRLVARHTMLRTSFVWERRDDPLQVVHREAKLEITHHDLRPVAAAERGERVAELLRSERGRAFDLRRPPLLRVSVIRQEETVYRLAINFHHLILDGWSAAILLRELVTLYAKPGAALPSIPDFGLYMDWLRRQDQQAAEAYWRRTLSGFMAPTPLGGERSRVHGLPEERGFAERYDHLPAARLEVLQNFARSRGLTLNTLVQGAWALLLSRYAGQRDVVYGTTLSGRPASLPGAESMVGLLINTLPVRAVVGEDEAGQWLHAFQGAFSELRQYEYSPLVEVHGWSDVPRGVDLFDTLMIFENYPASEAGEEGDLRVRSSRSFERAHYPLALLVSAENVLNLRLIYDRARFDNVTADRLRRHFIQLLEGLTEPGQRLLEISPLGAAERHQLRIEWNDTRRKQTAPGPLGVLREVALERWDRVVFRFADQHLSHGRLVAEVRAVAAALSEAGLGRGDVAVYFAPRDLRFPVAVLGTFAAGMAYLPVDPRQPAARLASLLERSGARAVLLAPELAPELAATGAAPETVLELSGASSRGAESTNFPVPEVEDLAYLLYTSGSTGEPKAAMVHHDGMRNHLWAKIEDLNLASVDTLAQTASTTFDISVWQLLSGLLVGAVTEIYGDEVVGDPALLLAALARHRVTVVETVPSLLRFLLEELEDNGDPALSLRWMIPTGEALPPDLARRWLQHFPEVPLVNAYGPTECSDDVTHALLRTPPPEGAEGVPIGRGVRNLRSEVVDGGLRLQPLGIAGELVVGGIGVGRGYLGDPRRTALAFIPDPHGDPGSRLYRTGDLTRRLDDGQLEFLGRMDHQVKVRGFRIELGEIEAAIEQHPAVAQGVVDVRDDQGQKRLVAYVVPAEDGEGGAGEEVRVEQWQAIFDEMYEHGERSSQEEAINLRVWVDSYTGRALPQKEIFECFEDSVARILALRPRRVLEIGCGTGLLLERIAPHTESYWGTDLSGAVIEELERRARGRFEGTEIHLLRRSAEDLEGVPETFFDVVVLNEVVQYFPGVEYLLAVLQGMVRVARPGGVLFIGGVRNEVLMPAFQTGVVLAGAEPQMAVAEAVTLSRRRRSQDKELAVSPALFHALPHHLESVSAARIELKGGEALNELTRFRFDAFLRVGGDEIGESDVEWLDWQSEALDFEALAERLAKEPESLAVSGVPNARLAEEVRVRELLSLGGFDTVGDLRAAASRAAAASPGVEPQALRRLAREHGYEVRLGWRGHEREGEMEAVFVRADRDPFAIVSAPQKPLDAAAHQGRWSQLANRPFSGVVGGALAPFLRGWLAERLPEHMVPSTLVFLESLPLTANGKLDRKALPDPEVPTDSDARPFSRRPLEEIVAGIWQEVLGIERVHSDDDFFVLGGHSLLATRVTARLRKGLGVDLNVRDLFEASTVTALASRLERELTGASPVAELPVIEPLPQDSSGVPADGAPTTFSQERLWFLGRLDPSDIAYNLAGAVVLEGVLEVAALSAAVEGVRRRHGSLRTSFEERDGRPWQKVEPWSPRPLPLVDLASLPRIRIEREVLRVASRQALAPYDLDSGPLLRVALLRQSAERHVLVFGLHHVVGDGWSLEILVRETARLYRAAILGEAASLPELPVQYADFAAWQRRWVSGAVLEEELRYWRQSLEGLSGVLELPTDHPRGASSPRGGRLRFTVGPEHTTALRALAQGRSATFFMVLLATFESLLARHTGQRDLAVGTPVAGRDRLETEDLVGLFVNTLVLRGKPRPELPFIDLLDQVREASLGAFSHPQVPFERLVDELGLERDWNRSPLVQALFVLQNTPRPEESLPNLSIRPLELPFGGAQFELVLSFEEWGEGLRGGIEYRADLFESTTIERLVRGLERLLAAIPEQADQPLAELPLLAPEERWQLLGEWSGGRPGKRWEGCLHEAFFRQAEHTPDALAVSSGMGSQSYGELARRAASLAERLAELGIGPEIGVGLHLERSPEMVLAVLAVLQSGGFFVPLSPSQPATRRLQVVAEAGLDLVLSDVSTPFEDYDGRQLFLGETTDLTPQEGEGSSPTTSENAAYALFTSGSTGTPKGVLVPHQAIVQRVGWMVEEFGPEVGARVLHKTPLVFDAALWELFLPWWVGGCVELAEVGSEGDGAALIQQVRDRRVGTLQLVPSVLQVVAGEPELSSLGELRWLFCGGEPLPMARVAEVRSALPRLAVHNTYGPTEAAIDVTHRPVEDAGTGTAGLGRPLPRATVHVLDNELAPVPAGATGELFLSGDHLARGYLGRPAWTAAAFLPHPYPRSFGASPVGERLYRTGDLGRFTASGELEIVGRVDRQVKLRGQRVELGEIEAVLGTHPEVREVAVAVVQDILAGYVALRDSGVEVESIRSWAGRRLPAHMVPGSWTLLEALPRTASGKLDRRALPDPDPAARAGSRAASGEEEELIAGLFATVLDLEEAPGVEESFFALGGHSLLATQVISRLRTSFEVEISLRRLFETPTVLGLVEAVAEARRESSPSMPPLLKTERPVEGWPLSFAQQRLWFLDQLDPESSAYHLSLALELLGPLSGTAFRAALSTVVNRHEVLRSRITERDGEPRMVVEEEFELPLEEEDFGPLGDGEWRAALARRAGEEASRAFALTRGPLFRAHLLRRSSEHHALVMTFHHLVADGWSLGILLRELATAYGAVGEEEVHPLPPLEIQYGDYATWQREWLQGPVLEAQLVWWREHLMGAPRVLDLPVDHPRPSVQSSRGGAVKVGIDASAMASLERRARERGATPFMAILAIFAGLLGRWSGQDDLLVGTPVAGRGRVEIEPLMGVFTNTLVLRTRLRSGSVTPDFGGLLAEARHTVLGGTAHGELPFERLVEALGVERDLSRSPLFQVMIGYNNAPLPRLEMAGLRLESVPADHHGAQFDLTLDLRPKGDGGLGGLLIYAADLFDSSTMARLGSRFEELLRAVPAEPEIPFTEWSLLTDAEDHQLLFEWNDTSRSTAEDEPVHRRVEALAAARPERLALLLGDNHAMTYGELAQRSRRLAQGLRAEGAGPEVPVGLCLERSAEMVVALLAIHWAGAFYVPLDPLYPAARLRYMLEDSGAPLLLTREALASGLGFTEGSWRVLDVEWLESKARRQEPAGTELPGTDPERLAYTIYTSGSTGRPKGVGVSHRALSNFLASMENRPGLRAGEVLAAVTSLSFDIAALELFLPLRVGGTVALVSREDALDGAVLAARLETSNARVLQATPSTWRLLLDAGWAGQKELRALCGGEALPVDLAERLLEHCGEVWNLYGPTETTVWSAVHRLRGEQGTSVSIGRPIANTSIHLLDRDFRPVPSGAVGDLYIGGAGLARAYRGRPALTADRFLPDPFGSLGARLYRAGDRARFRPDGRLAFLGRTDHQVKVRGFRVEPGEIEVLLAAEESVEQAVVVAREDERLGARLVAYLVARAEEAPDPVVLRDRLREGLPEYMVPSVFMVLESLPLTPNGKVDKNALPEPQLVPRGEGREPQTESEGIVARVWTEVLGLDEVRMEDNFFDLGGHSLLANGVLSRLRQETGVELPMRELFLRPTAEGLAARLDQELLEVAGDERMDALLDLLESTEDDAALEALLQGNDALAGDDPEARG